MLVKVTALFDECCMVDNITCTSHLLINQMTSFLTCHIA